MEPQPRPQVNLTIYLTINYLQENKPSHRGIFLPKNDSIAAGKYKVVVHDREPATLDFIEKGFIDATLINKTAGQEFMAMLVLEDWNNGGVKNIPISADNAKAGVNPVPDNMINTAVVIDKTNVQYFKAEAIPVTKTSLYNR